MSRPTGLQLAGAALGALGLLAWPGRSRARSGFKARVRSWPGAVRARLRRQRADPDDVLLALVEAVAAQVRAGAEPTAAWQVAVSVTGADRQVDWPAGRDPIAVLRGWSALQGRTTAGTAAAGVAAGWALAQRTGAPLADVLAAAVRGLRRDLATAAELEAALAAPRATARMLGVLPLGGLVLGELVGAGPLRVLATTRPGQLCAVGGAALLALSHWWMRRLVADAAATR